MSVQIRNHRPSDTDPIVALSLRAWAPVFDSMLATVGGQIFRELFGEDWRDHQERSVRHTCSEKRVSVAVSDGAVVGFTAIHVPDEGTLGEIYMLAVDPEHQGRGIGSALTRHAVDRIRDAGMKMVVVSTGGDPGHAPARSTYEKAGFVSLPSEHYYLVL